MEDKEQLIKQLRQEIADKVWILIWLLFNISLELFFSYILIINKYLFILYIYFSSLFLLGKKDRAFNTAVRKTKKRIGKNKRRKESST